MSSSKGSTAQRHSVPVEIWVLVGSAFTIAIGFGLVAPALPQFARSFGVGVAAASFIVSAFALMRLVFAPMSGKLMQRLGERPVYLTGLVIVAVSTGACAFAQTYWQLLVLRSLGGIGSTMFTVSSLALVIRMSPPAERGRISGIYSTSFLIGSIAGPLVGGALTFLGLRAPFLIYCVALLVASLIVYVALKDSPLVQPETVHGMKVMTFRDGFARPEYRAALWANFGNGAAVFGVRMALVPLIVVEVLDEGAGMAGVALTVFAIGNAAVLFLSGRWSDQLGRKPFLIAGTLICAIGTAGLGLAPNLIWFMVASCVAGIGSGVFSPALQASVADVVGPSTRGGPVLAGYQMAGDLGTFLGPYAIGLLADNVSYGLALLVTGVILASASALWVVTPETLRRKEAAVSMPA
ncbi:MFS transporter [Nocardia sp. 2]|uniref:MFS transporter n=1 Tax=Nocardia acididurans TaxID=2802282 RepID=A0ABS1M2N3_9NOCA|nr:MFS transporter [Nocardia acididurans]MBL1074786.1 MFS transporter [Nocardia acididurans]